MNTNGEISSHVNYLYISNQITYYIDDIRVHIHFAIKTTMFVTIYIMLYDYVIVINLFSYSYL